MDELELVRLHEDGDRLVVTGPDGAEHLLPITDALRAAVRGDRPRMESIRADEELAMRPRDIQARLRAGATAEGLAAESGMPAEQIRRFEYPVISEREHAVGRVRAKAVMSEDGGTATIGDLADKRLRDRDSNPATVRWTATREGIAPWVVTLAFTVDAGERMARWSFDPRGGAVIALDDEARWLARPEDDGGPVSRTVTTLPPTRGYGRAAVVDDETDLLLDGLSERRGQRPQRSTSPSDVDAGELDLDDLSPRRRPGPAARAAGERRASGPKERPAAGDDPTEPDPAPAAVVDLGARRGKHTDSGTGPASGAGAPDEPSAGSQIEWDGPSQWEIPGPDTDEERRPRTAALRTGGPLTGAVPKALRPATGATARTKPGADGAQQGGADGAASPVSGTKASGTKASGTKVSGTKVSGTRASDTTASDTATAARAAREAESAAERDTGRRSADRTADHAGPEKAKPASRRRSARRGRAQVPSWDEIVFGSRPEG
ncbi:septation protein SepH [Myceligenerans indicum]|uniref:DUF3071 domain-containing protein n=1 Tax=Myceligenerans indicum TaxID=2593663 RepID=A0ABS1LHE7_9MICO|nr:septation protein SepH [Myceligenerans indicum]MBL0885646.1 DUF3071 domain-containing protein [Myceligenerans indicum]